MKRLTKVNYGGENNSGEDFEFNSVMTISRRARMADTKLREALNVFLFATLVSLFFQKKAFNSPSIFQQLFLFFFSFVATLGTVMTAMSKRFLGSLKKSF